MIRISFAGCFSDDVWHRPMPFEKWICFSRLHRRGVHLFSFRILFLDKLAKSFFSEVGGSSSTPNSIAEGSLDQLNQLYNLESESIHCPFLIACPMQILNESHRSPVGDQIEFHSFARSSRWLTLMSAMDPEFTSKKTFATKFKFST